MGGGHLYVCSLTVDYREKKAWHVRIVVPAGRDLNAREQPRSPDRTGTWQGIPRWKERIRTSWGDPRPQQCFSIAPSLTAAVSGAGCVRNNQERCHAL